MALFKFQVHLLYAQSVTVQCSNVVGGVGVIGNWLVHFFLFFFVQGRVRVVCVLVWPSVNLLLGTFFWAFNFRRK